jgi:hypothetical protein
MLMDCVALKLPYYSRNARELCAEPSRVASVSCAESILLVALLVGALTLTFSVLRQSSLTGGNAIRLLLVPAENSIILSPGELTTTRTILSERFSSFGLPEASVQATTANGHPAILVELPHFGGNEQLVLNTLLENGQSASHATNF